MRLDYLPDQAHSTSSTAVPVRIVRRRRESMKLPVDTSTIAFLCAVEAEPVVDFETKRPRADENGEPLYQHVMADRQGAIAAALDGLVRDAENSNRPAGRARRGHDAPRRGNGKRVAGL
jgi:hypothetical protein